MPMPLKLSPRPAIPSTPQSPNVCMITFMQLVVGKSPIRLIKPFGDAYLQHRPSCAKKVWRLNRPMLKYSDLHRPDVRLFCAQSLRLMMTNLQSTLTITGLLMSLVGASPVWAGDATGTWTTEGGKSRVRISALAQIFAALLSGCKCPTLKKARRNWIIIIQTPASVRARCLAYRSFCPCKPMVRIAGLAQSIILKMARPIRPLSPYRGSARPI